MDLNEAQQAERLVHMIRVDLLGRADCTQIL